MAFRKKIKQQGVDDLVLLSKTTEDGILDNLKRRFGSDIIYTYIGHVLISVNPFKAVAATAAEEMQNYVGKFPYENPPNVYALAELAYRNLVFEKENQAVIISGESGAGKTVAASLLVKYIATMSGGQGVQHIKDVLVESNPVLEAFGNAKTLRNNNSSRFGKFFELIFDYTGSPLGGKITNYLLEKSRVVCQIPGERNFHIFYQLLAGLSADEKAQFCLTEAANYRILSLGDCLVVDGVDDAKEFRDMRRALDIIGFSNEDIYNIFSMLAGILHLGNVTFGSDGSDGSYIIEPGHLDLAAYFFGVSSTQLTDALSNRVRQMGSRASIVRSPLSPEQAGHSRDAICKAVYDRLFNWLVMRINAAMVTHERKSVMIGVLDIYGFEIFNQNGFEQFCINYVNEKLQQIFIDLTLRSEQQEYASEGIKWEEIDYFDNSVVCELLESSKMPPGIFLQLDDACRTGHAMESRRLDERFVSELGKFFSDSPHCRISNNGFTIRHYAGDVSYSAYGFSDKNKDLLFQELVAVMAQSENPFVQMMFPAEEASGLKAPSTAGFKIRKSANELVQTLSSCHPHYIRCIKPNETKRAGDFEDDRVLHQIKYLGLLENVRVRRAGFAYRENFSRFFTRFAILHRDHLKWLSRLRDAHGKEIPDAVARDGVSSLLAALRYDPSEYQMGRTKVFIRHPETFFGLEELRERKMIECVNKIKRTWRWARIREQFRQIQLNTADILHMKKERRRFTLNRQYFADYVGAADDYHIQDIMKAAGEIRILFADVAEGFKHKRFTKTHTVPRLLLLCERNLFLLVHDEKIARSNQGLRPSDHKQPYEIKLSVPLQDIVSCKLSPFSDDFLCIALSPSHPCDITAINVHKTEILAQISDRMMQVCGRRLAVEFSAEISYRVKSGSGTRTWIFSKDSSLREAKWKPDGKKVLVFSPEGLPASSKPNAPYQMKAKSSTSHPSPISSSVSLNQPSSSVSLNQPSSSYGAPPSAPPMLSNAQTPSFRPPAPPSASSSIVVPVAAPVVVSSSSRGQPPPPPAPKARPPAPPPPAPKKRLYKALYDYIGQESDELSLSQGDVIELIEKDNTGWWKGRVGTRVGVFPENYVQELT